MADGSALEGPAGFDIGNFHLSFYPSEDRVTFIVFDPERPEMAEFEHLLYFPPDRNYAVDAKLVVHPDPEKIEIPTTRNLIKTFYKYAAIEFEMDGEKQQLTALKSELTGAGSEGLFIAFRDVTTGRETYGAGRYLQIEEPASESFVLDFNRAFNPLCNYSDAYNCTLPPRENHMKVAIRARRNDVTHTDRCRWGPTWGPQGAILPSAARTPMEVPTPNPGSVCCQNPSRGSKRCQRFVRVVR